MNVLTLTYIYWMGLTLIMYPLQKKTRSIIKKSFKYAAGVNPFDWEELQEEKNKKHKPFKSYVGYKDGNVIRYQCNQNLWFEV